MKRALVTGGSGDIGAAICNQLAAAGLHVIVHANSRLAEAERTATAIRGGGGSAQAVAFDVAQPEQTEAALRELLSAGAIQVLVNNAGIHDDAVMPAMNRGQWSRVIDVSLNGFFNVTQPLLMPMMATRWGRVINITSVAALMGNRGQANYAAAKAGLIGFTKTVAAEVARRGVTINAVAPGFIETDMTADLPEGVLDLVPARRVGTPEEVAACVRFLASDDAGYVTGTTLFVDGGMSA
jgi:3-oxoacyl-[acyl-carrier protein] reductase